MGKNRRREYVRVPYGVYHTASTSKCEQEQCLKYSGCILCNIPPRKHKQLFQGREKKRKKKLMATQYKVCVQEVGRHRAAEI